MSEQVVLITGASSGIGRALARELYVNRGCRVALAARNVAELEAIRNSLVKVAM